MSDPFVKNTWLGVRPTLNFLGQSCFGTEGRQECNKVLEIQSIYHLKQSLQTTHDQNGEIWSYRTQSRPTKNQFPKKSTWESGFNANSGTDKNSSDEMNPFAFLSNWQNLLYRDTISCWVTTSSVSKNNRLILIARKKLKRDQETRTYIDDNSVLELLQYRTGSTLMTHYPLLRINLFQNPQKKNLQIWRKICGSKSNILVSKFTPKSENLIIFPICFQWRR